MIVQDFLVRWDQALCSAKWNAVLDTVLEGLYESRITGFRSARNSTKQWTNELFKIEDISETWTIDPEDEKSEPQMSGAKWFMEEWWHGVEKEIKPTLRGKWEISGSGKQLDNGQKETHVVSIMCSVLLETV